MEKVRIKKKTPEFSVLLSLYKNEKPEFLRQALDSLLNQTLLPNEILIVKDGLLTDELEEVLKEYAEKSNLFRFLEFQENRGLGLALRDGVLACKYEYIARMDTDDICKPERFEKQFKFLMDNPEIDLLGTWIKEFSVNPNHPDSITKLPCKQQEILKFSKSRNPFRHMTVVLKKSAVLESGNYRDFLWFEDYDLWVRMLQKGCKVANLPEFLVDVRADNGMFARRGGWKYLKQDVKFQKLLLKSRFIGILQFINNVVVRTLVRIMPNRIRSLIYLKFLRKEI